MKILRLMVLSMAAVAIAAQGAISPDAEQLRRLAEEQLAANNMEQALTLCLAADSAYLAENRESTAEYAQALHDTGRTYLSMDNVELGREYTLQAMALREDILGKTSVDYIASANNYAYSFFMAEDLDEARRLMTEVIDLCRLSGTPNPNEGMYLFTLARICRAAKDDEAAIKWAEEALPKLEKFSQGYELVLDFLGRYYMERDDNANMNRIMGLADEVLQHQLEQECDDPDCHLERAEILYSRGDPASAKEEFLAVFAMPLTDSQKAKACQKYAEYLTDQRDYALAGEYYSMAAKAKEEGEGAVSEGTVALAWLAGTYYFLGKDFDKSIEIYGEVVADVDKFGLPEKHKTSSLEGLGNAYSAKEDYMDAILVFRQLMEHLQAHGHENEAAYANACELLAAAEKNFGDYDASIKDYEKAIELYGKLGMAREQQDASVGLRMSKMNAGMDPGDIVESTAAQEQREKTIRETLRSSLNSLEQGGEYLGRLSKAQNLATVAGGYAMLDSIPKAVDYYSEYMHVVRPALAEVFLLKNAKERELIWRHELDDITEMTALIGQLPEDDMDSYARLSTLVYDGQLLSKGILLSSSIEYDKVLNRFGTEAMKARYDSIKANLAAIEEMEQRHEPEEDILRMIRVTDDMQLSLARESAKYGIYTDFLNITSEDVARALGPDEAAIEFVTLGMDGSPDDDMILAVMISREYPTGITIPVASVGEIKSIIASPDKFSNEVYTAKIWGSILQALPIKKRIYFAPDGILHNIGIEYMQLGGKPLDEYLELLRLSSTREIARTHTDQPLQYAALFGDIDYIDKGLPASRKKHAKRESNGVSFGRLEATGREVMEIEKILKKNVKKARVFPYTGAKASKAEFLSQKDVPVNLLHIATHGKYVDSGSLSEADAMLRSVLAFAGANRHDDYVGNEGIVNAAEIAEMTLQDCELVVLSACESGLGKLGDDGVYGLQRGFKNAGAKSLLVSLKAVADEATADMMIAFYRNLFEEEGCTRREALRKAQSEIRSKYPDDDTWASFILIDSFN